MTEEWKIIRTTKTRIIKVSNLGNLQDICTRNWHNYSKGQTIFNNVLINKENGYVRSKSCNEYVHKLVAEAFIPNPFNKPEVDHIDNNKMNNSADNLQWVTHKENCNNLITRKHNSTNSKKSQNNPDTILRKSFAMFGKNSKKIIQLTKSGEFITEWHSAKEVERALGIASANIGKCCLGKRKYAGGYIWKVI